MERKTSLDFTRSIAILSVLMLHTLEFSHDMPYPIRYILNFGWAGVDLFFVLSGFLIGQQVFNHQHVEVKTEIRNFWIKRWTRTLPLYFIVLFVYFWIKPFIIHKEFVQSKWPYFLLIQNYFRPMDFVQSWSLCIEEQFYLIFPILYFLGKLRKLPKWIWILPAFASTYFRYTHYHGQQTIQGLNELAYQFQFPFHMHLDGISYGLVLAGYKDSWTSFKHKKWFLPLSLLCLFATFAYIGPANSNESIVYSYHLIAFSFAIFIIGIYDYEISFGKVFYTKTALWSYGLYLWNNLVAKFVIKLKYESFLLNFIIFFGLSYLLSMITYEYVEKFGLNLRKKLLK